MLTQTNYRYSHSIGIYALLGRGFNNPVDVAFGPEGVLYVLNRAGPEVAVRMPYKRVSMCTVDSEFLGEFSSGGTGDGQLMWPASIAIDRDANVYVSDEALHRVTVFDSKGNFLRNWGTRGSGDGQLNRPAGIAFDGNDNLLVVDGMNNRIQRFTRDGIFLDEWGSGGSGEGEFNIPWGIAVDEDDNVFVADWRNDRIQKFDGEGKFLAEFGGPGEDDGKFNRPSGVTVDADGNIYVADWGNERVQILGPNGDFVTKFRGESGMSKWADDYFSANTEEWEIRQQADLEPEFDAPPDDFAREESANIEKLFWGPVSVKLDDQGRMFVVESCRHRIQIYQKSI